MNTLSLDDFKKRTEKTISKKSLHKIVGGTGATTQTDKYTKIWGVQGASGG